MENWIRALYGLPLREVQEVKSPTSKERKSSMGNIGKPPTKEEYVAWRRKWVAQEYEKGKTLREMAKVLGVSKNTVFRDYQQG